MRNEIPDWNRGDTIRSIIEVAAIGKAALAECIVDSANWIDKKLKEKTDDSTDK